MELVGRHLEEQAERRASMPVEFDLFGRSAFNRYYYATFLLARAMMRNFNPNWQGPHKGFPDELIGSTGKVLRTAKLRARKVGDKALESKCAVGRHHVHELADPLLRQAQDERGRGAFGCGSPQTSATGTPSSGAALARRASRVTRAQPCAAAMARWSASLARNARS